MEFDLEKPLLAILVLQQHQSESESESEDGDDDVQVEALFISESDHMPSKISIQTSKSKDLNNNSSTVRSEAISMILQAKLDPFTSYLAINYFDRFIFREGMLDFFDRKGKPWILRLITDSCLSLAMKMKKIDFSINDFQRDDDDEAAATFVLDSRTLHRSELLILGALNWRMRSVTPFAFTRFFISMLELEDLPLKQALSARVKEIIFKAQNEINILEFKPSIIAAASILQASQELFPSEFPSYKTTISSCANVDNQQLMECCEVMNKYLGCNKVVMSISEETPKNVLDRHGWSSAATVEGERITVVDVESNQDKELVEKGSS